MLQRSLLAAMLLFLVCTLGASAEGKMSGAWYFKTSGDQVRGTIELHQEADGLNGIWHTVVGKQEKDTAVSGTITGNTVNLIRTLSGNKLQKYVLTVTADKNQINGFGDGEGINHANLDMIRATYLQKVEKQREQASGFAGFGLSNLFNSKDMGGLVGLLTFPVLIVVFGLIREFIMSGLGGWKKLADVCPCVLEPIVDWKACWWLGLITRGPGLTRIGNYGKMKFAWQRIFGVPEVWVASDSKGLYLKRNLWNFSHKGIFIPWAKIASAQEVPHTAWGGYPIRGYSPSRAVPNNALTNTLSALSFRMVEVQLSDPQVTIFTDLDLLNNGRSYLGSKFLPTERA